MTNLEMIKNILANLNKRTGTASASLSVTADNAELFKKSVPTEDKPDEYISCRYTDLLNEIVYFPNGNAPIEHNSLWSTADKGAGKKCFWFCSDKPIGYTSADGKAVIFKHRDSEEVRKMNAKFKSTPTSCTENAFERYKKSIAKKWAMERDWIPDYRYDFRDLEEEVGLCVQEMLADGVDRAKITKKCFDRLDNVYRAQREYNSIPKEEVCNDAERFMYAMLFTDDVNTLHILESLDGTDLPLPTVEDLEQFSENDLEQFGKIKVLFDRTRSKHANTSAETWLSAQCYALNMPTRDAVMYIYGDGANGKKKYHRGEVKYSRQANQVFSWLLEEAENMLNEGVADGLEKWIAVAERHRAISWCEKAYNLIKKYGLMSIESGSPREESLLSLIVTDPEKVEELFKGIITDAETHHNCDLFSELDGFSDNVSKNEVAFGIATDNDELIMQSSDMPF